MQKDVPSKFIHKMLVIIVIYHLDCNAIIAVKVQLWIVEINNLVLIVGNDHRFIFVVPVDINYFVVVY